MPKKGQFDTSILGKKFGMLTVTHLTQGKYRSLVNCICDCGKTCTTRGTTLKSGKKLSCGCLKFKDISGKRFGKLLAIRRIDSTLFNSETVWEFKCDCGKIINRKCSLARAKLAAKHCGCETNSLGKIYNALYRKYKDNAISRDIEFNLTFNEFCDLIKKNCYYCNMEPRNSFQRNKGTQIIIFNGIDRIDNLIGYESNNIVPCCKYCNIAKAQMTKEYFYEHITKIYLNLKEKNLV